MSLLPYWQRKNLEGVPILGDWILTAGHIENILATNCEIDPWIVVQAGFHELPTLIVSIFKPDPQDAYLSSIGPPGAGPGGHGRRRRQKKRPPFRWQGGTLIFGQPVNAFGGPSWLFRLGTLAQRAGFYLLVADATVDFALRWTSTVYEWSGCLPQDYWEKTVGIFNPPFGYAGTAVKTVWHVQGSSGPGTATKDSIHCPADVDLDAQVDVEFEIDNISTEELQVQIDVVLDPGDNVIYSTGPQVIQQGQTAPARLFKSIGRAPVDRSLSVQVSTVGGPVNEVDGSRWGVISHVDSLLDADPP